MNLNKLAADIHQQNVDAGWWDEWPNKIDRMLTARMLVVTELAEAAEGVRKDLMDDHLPHHKMLHVELADAAIRLLDLAGAYDIGLVFDPSEIEMQNEVYSARRSNDLERLDNVVFACHSSPVRWIDVTMFAIIALAQFHEIDLFAIIEEKRAYNVQRADHKRENRAKPGGKAF